jgi:aspartate ammonia-lyase
MEEPKLAFGIDETHLSTSILCVKTHSISQYKLGDFPLLVQLLLKVKAAASFANCDTEAINKTIADRIVVSCKNLCDSSNAHLFMVDVFQGGGGFAINSNVNEAIRAVDAMINADPTPLVIDDINRCQSSTDVCATALRLALHLSVCSLAEEISLLMASLDNFVTEHKDVTTLARTCWQDALPIKLMDRFLGINDTLNYSRTRLLACRDELLFIPLGSTVLGTGFGASDHYRKSVIEHLAKETNLPIKMQPNPMAMAQNFADLSSLASEIKTLCQNIIRLGLDLRLLNSGPKGGLSELTLPKVMQGSSFFAHKFNPTIIETAIQGSVFAHSLLGSIDMYRIMPEIDLNVFEWAAGMNITLALEMLCPSIRRLNHNAIVGMTANHARCFELSQFAHPTRGSHERTMHSNDLRVATTA